MQWAMGVLLALSLLASQVLGVIHRIDHAGIVPGVSWSGATLQVDGHEDSHGSGHSCVLFDAASLADTFDVPPPAHSMPTAAGIATGLPDFASQPRRTACPFFSRAPPVA